MEKQRKMAMVVRIVTFAEAEEIDIEYYAGLDWKQSATTVEEMRRGIWADEYEQKPDRSFVGISKLNDDRDDIE